MAARTGGGEQGDPGRERVSDAGTGRPHVRTAGTRKAARARAARERATAAITTTGAPHAAAARRIEETSAGGLVLDGRGPDASVVLIGRLDRRGRLLWSLPKGHLEAGETREDAAIREVAEETGIHGRIVASLGSIDFWFTADGRRIHKTVHHYLLLAEGGELSDEDVEVTEVAWVPLAQAPERLAYATERALLAKVPALLARAG